MFEFVRRLFNGDRASESVPSNEAKGAHRSAAEELRDTFQRCKLFVRDTTLRTDLYNKYHVGMLLTDPTYCDASCKVGGFVAPDRYLIISTDRQTLDVPGADEWGLCIWQRDSIFKVVDKREEAGHRQVALLEIPRHLLHYFRNVQLRAYPETALC